MTTLKELSEWPQSRIMAAFTAELPRFPRGYKGKAPICPVAMRTPMALVLSIMAAVEEFNDNRELIIDKFSLAMDGYIKNGLLTPAYGDLYELATAYAGYRDNKNMVAARVGIVFAFGEQEPKQEDKSDENSNC